MDVAQQLMKTDLIENSVLGGCRWDKEGKPTSYKLTEDMIFPSIVQNQGLCCWLGNISIKDFRVFLVKLNVI